MSSMGRRGAYCLQRLDGRDLVHLRLERLFAFVLGAGAPPETTVREADATICTAATVHFAAAVANFSWLETRASPAETHLGFDNSEFFPVQPRLHEAHYPVSDAPGLGVEVNETLIQAQAFKFWEAPHLKRSDGSVTNW